MRTQKLALLAITIITTQLVGQALNENFSANFPPELWKVYNQDAGQFTWSKSYIKFFSCPACARVRFDGRTITNDDWLVTRKVYPTPNNNQLRFFYRSHNARPESLEIYVSTTTNRPEDFQYRLDAFRFNNPSYAERTYSLAQFDSTPIYIAFRYPKRFGRAIYLDDITGPSYIPKDVGVKGIVTPPLYLGHGTTVYPQIIVKNYGAQEAESFQVSLVITDSLTSGIVYSSEQTVGNLSAQDSVLITFPLSWQSQVGTYQVTAFTQLAGDMDLTNDTVHQRTQVVTADLNDVAVTAILLPQGTLPPGTITPQAMVANYGTNTATFLVAFDIIHENNTVYTDTESITLESNHSAIIDFSAWIATSGIYQSVVRAMIENDVDTTNNTLTDMFEIITYYRDVGAMRIVAPTGELLQYSTVVPQAEVENFGDLTETFWVKFWIGEDYEDSVNVTLNSGESQLVNFSLWTANEIGTFATKCSTAFSDDADPLNDFVTDSVRVVPGAALNENLSPLTFKITPNPFETKLTFSLNPETEATVAIYNSAGILVRRLQVRNGTNWDGTDEKGYRLPKGIYFLRIESNPLPSKVIFH